MTRDEVIALAKECGGSIIPPYDMESDHEQIILLFDEIERLAAAIEARVREGCAVICDEQGDEWDSDNQVTEKNYAAYCATAIRAWSDAADAIRSKTVL